MFSSVPLQVPGPANAGRPSTAFQRAHSALVALHQRDQDGDEADYQTSPLCAFVLPNHLEGSLEFFNADGSGAGSLIPADEAVLLAVCARNLHTRGQDPASSLEQSHAVEFARSKWSIGD